MVAPKLDLNKLERNTSDMVSVERYETQLLDKQNAELTQPD